MKFIATLTLLPILIATWPHKVISQTSEQPFGENFRERCRKVVSGTYADSWNEANRAREANILAERTLKQLKPRQERNNKELSEIQRKLKGEQFDPALLQKREELVGLIKLYHEQIDSQEGIADKAKASAKKSAETHSSLERDIKRIFKISFVDDPEGLPRKIFHELTWISACPKYRALCPLPISEAQVLKVLAGKIVDDEKACLKYASLK